MTLADAVPGRSHLFGSERTRYVRNCWYVFAWSREVGDEPFSRTVLDEPIVVFRGRDGSINALEDRCPHRGAPLRLGKIAGGAIACGYHGLVFDGGGTCVVNPHGSGKIPATARVKSYPVVERYHLVWVWMGDPAAADDTTIPDYGWTTDGSHAIGIGSYLRGAANYLLFLDNLLDLSHAQYLHPLFGNDAMAQSDVLIEQNGSQVWAKRIISNQAATLRFRPLLGVDGSVMVDHWLEVRWDAAGAMRINAGATRTGDDRKAGVEIVATHIVTPESEFSTHYFFNNAQAFRLDDPSITTQGSAIAEKIFSTEDLPMLEAQQETLRKPGMALEAPVMLSADAGAIRVRRLLATMIDLEASLLR